MNLPIYLDNHATTRVDPRVIEAMLPFLTETFGNPASKHHRFGWSAEEAVEASRESIAAAIGAQTREIIFTSGATESNNMAIRGVAEVPRRKGNHLVSVATEHPAVLEPLRWLERRGCEVTVLPVTKSSDPHAGRILPEQVARAIRDDTILVSVMLANHEIGAIHPLEEIGAICRERGVALHTDATQAVGKIPLDVDRLQVDMMSFTAHKMYGPKGVGGLFLRRRPHVRIEPIVRGGGHERGLRSGTSNVPGIVGFAKAMQLCIEEMPQESERLRSLRDRLFDGLTAALPGVELNGPALSPPELRLPGNLNVSFANVQGESLLMSTPSVAASPGSACGSSKSEASHVLRALGLDEDLASGCVRFGLGRFNTAEEVEHAIAAVSESVARLRKMSSFSVDSTAKTRRTPS